MCVAEGQDPLDPTSDLDPERECDLFEIDPDTEYPIGCSLYGKSALNFKHIKSCASFIVRRLNMVESVVLHIENLTPRWKILGGKT